MQYSSLLLGCQFLIQHYLPIKFKYWQKKVNEEQRENKIKKQTQTQTQIEMETKNAMESLSMVHEKDRDSGEFVHTWHVKKMPEEKDHGLPEKMAVTEMIVRDSLAQKSMRKKPSQTVMAVFIAHRSAAWSI